MIKKVFYDWSNDPTDPNFYMAGWTKLEDCIKYLKKHKKSLPYNAKVYKVTVIVEKVPNERCF